MLGTNGNGKSTLMKCVAGLVRPERGSLSLTIDGEAHDLTKLSAEAIVDLGVALVPGGTAAVSQADGAGKPDARRFPQSGPRRTSIATWRWPSRPFRPSRSAAGQLAGTMSGGQQQMLAIARALMSSPRLLLIDEPSVGLSPLLVSQTIAKIGELKQRLGLTVLMAEQNFNQAIRIADRGYIIVHGEIVVAAAVGRRIERPTTSSSGSISAGSSDGNDGIVTVSGSSCRFYSLACCRRLPHNLSSRRCR